MRPPSPGRLFHTIGWALGWGAMVGGLVFGGCRIQNRPLPLLAPQAPRSIQLLWLNSPHMALTRRDMRQTVVHTAQAFLKAKHPGPYRVHGVRFDPDPVGFVRAAFWQASVDVFAPSVAAHPTAHGMEILYRSADLQGQLHRHQPQPGDVVFWASNPKATYPSDVGVVESCQPDGTVVALGRFAQGPARIKFNLRSPHDPKRNTLLKKKNIFWASDLFRAFADPWHQASTSQHTEPRRNARLIK